MEIQNKNTEENTSVEEMQSRISYLEDEIEKMKLQDQKKKLQKDIDHERETALTLEQACDSVEKAKKDILSVYDVYTPAVHPKNPPILKELNNFFSYHDLVLKSIPSKIKDLESELAEIESKLEEIEKRRNNQS